MKKSISCVAFLLLLTACSNGFDPLDSPSYTAAAPNDEWEPKKPLKGPSDTLSLFEGMLPTEEDTIALSEVLNISLSNNPQTETSWAKAKQASYEYQIALSDYFPEVDLELDATRQHQSIANSGTTAITNFSLLDQEISNESAGGSLTLTYVLWDFGQRSAKASEYLNALHYANWSHNEVIQSVIRASMDAYFAFLYQKAQLEALKTDLDDLQTSLDAAVDKLRFGVNDITDMLQAKTAYLAKKLEYETQIATKETSFQQLLNTMGVPGNVSFQTGSFPEAPDISDLSASANELITVAKKFRPDIAASKATLLQSEAMLKKAKADLWPTFNTTISGGERWFEGQSGLEPNYSLQVSLNYPVFAGFKYINSIRKAEAKVKQSQYALRMKELNVTQEVMAYYTDFEQARRLVTTSKEYLDSAQEEFVAILSNYERGTRTILDVLSAVSSLANARSQYVESKNKLYSSLANVAYAAGLLHSQNTQNVFHDVRMINEKAK